MRRTIERGLFVVALAVGSAALACPVCGYASKQQEVAYLAATAAMTLTPLAVVGGVFGWLFFQLRKSEAPAAEAPPATPAELTPHGER